MDMAREYVRKEKMELKKQRQRLIESKLRKN